MTTPATEAQSEATALDAVALSQLIEAGELSPVELVEGYLDRIRRYDSSVGAVVEVYPDEALEQAATVTADVAAGVPGGPLRGVPILVKDLYDVAGKATRSGSKTTPDTPRAEDSEAVARLRAAGSIILGKTTTHEFAFGVNTPPTRNPWDLERIPGGSSGGSGAAITAGFAAASLGTDTGGSIRIPAALTNSVGLKPTYSRVSKRGVTPLSWSLDHTGPITRSVRDAALMMNVLAGYDDGDPYSADIPVEDYTADLGRDLAGLRLGVSETYFCDRLDPDVAEAFEAAVRVLEQAGATIVPVEFGHVKLSGDICNVIAGVEAAAYHERRVGEVPELFTPDVLRNIRRGQLYSGTALANAHRARGLVRAGAHKMFATVEAFVSPTIAMVAPPFGAETVTLAGRPAPVLEGLNTLTVPANVAGIPALAVPAGLSHEGMPISLQIMGRAFDERTVLAVGHAFEQRTPWHKLQPELL